MNILQILAIVAGVGAVGGAVSALLSDDKGFLMPQRVKDCEKVVIRPGFIGLLVVGAAAAAVSYGLYGPLAAAQIDMNQQYSLKLSELAGALLIGIGGSKWLAAEVDKQVVQAAATTAARRHGDSDIAESIKDASPSAMLKLANQLDPVEP